MLRSLIVVAVALHVAGAFVIHDASPIEDDNYTKHFVTLKGRDYMFNMFTMLPSQAADYCRKYNMTLVNLETEKEVRTVYKYIEENLYTSVSYYTSGFRRSDEQSWTWSGNGKPMKYDYWGPDYDGSVQPNVPSYLDAWAYVYQGVLGDSANNLARNFICEERDKSLIGSSKLPEM